MLRWAYLCGDPGIPPLGGKGASIHVRQLVGALREAGDEVLLLARGRSAGKGQAGDRSPAVGDEAVAALPPGAAPAMVPPAGLWQSPAVADPCRAALRLGGRRPGGTRAGAAPAAAEAADLARDLGALAGMRGFGRAALPLLRGQAPDLLYERLALFGAAGLGLARRLDKPLILEVNAPLVEEQVRWRGLRLQRTAARVEDAVLRGADRVLVVSAALADWARSRGVAAGRILVLPNGVDPRPFQAADPAAVALCRREWGLGPAPVVGFVGGLRPWHGVADLLEAAALLQAQGRVLQLLIVGEGPLRAPLQAQAEGLGLGEHVTFTGAVAHERVPEILQLMDIAVAPYAAAPGGGAFYFSPLKVFEYLAAARPVVAADCGQLRSLLRPERTGLLYRPGDAADLAAALGRLLDAPPWARSLGEAGLAAVLAEHTWAQRAATVQDLGRELLRERRGEGRRAA